MMLNSVDLPQPDGPITERNSPGPTLNETSSTAVIGAVRRLETHDDVVDHQNGIACEAVAAAHRCISRSLARSSPRSSRAV